MNFIAIIPARYASTRLPGKPLADICGQTMIERVYRRVSSVVDDCIVATDDERIAACVERFGGRAVMTSTEHRSGTDRVAEALVKYEALSGKVFDVVINVQGDEPLIALDHIEKVKRLFGDQETQIATLVKRFETNEDIFNPNKPKVVIDKVGNALYFSRSVIPFRRNKPAEEWNDSSVEYFKHIGLYAYRSDVLQLITRLRQGVLEQAESLEQLRWLEHGIKVRVAQTSVESMSVDTPEDLERVRAVVAKGE